MLRKLGLICALIFCALGMSACNHNRELVTGLSENEAQRICVLLERNGLSASKLKSSGEDVVTWSVTVETPFLVGDDTIAAALYVLNENDLPRSRKNPYLEAFPKEGIIPSQTEERLRSLSATQESIELTLEKVTGIVSAQVHVVLPNPNPLVDANRQVQASSSVLLKYNTKTEPLSVEEVRSIVAPSVEGLSPDRVQVVMKAVPEPDINKFDNTKNKVIRIIGLASVALIGILVAALIYCFIRMRSLSSKIIQLERSQALRPPANKAQNQPVPAAGAAAR
jgi:type III secretion protein J